MQLYEWEGKALMKASGIRVPRSVLVRKIEDVKSAFEELSCAQIVVKAQVLSGKRGKYGGIKIANSLDEVVKISSELLGGEINNRPVIALLFEEALDIVEEHYISITYDTLLRQPVFLVSSKGGVDIEDVPENDIQRNTLDVRSTNIELDIPFAKELWSCFLSSDARLMEVNPLVKTKDGDWYAVDAKVILDDDAAFRHKEWSEYELRSDLARLPTEREKAVLKIDAGENYYRGTAGKYIELDGDIAVLFSGGGASISNMDALMNAGLQPANYTEYSGNPPREKVYELTKIVLSKPGLKGLWIAGGVANFTNVDETFKGIIDALAEVKPEYPIVVRRAGPHAEEGMARMQDCALQYGLKMKLFGKETSMTETASVLSEMLATRPQQILV
jgi:citryl-CoA synthetase large subunit